MAVSSLFQRRSVRFTLLSLLFFQFTIAQNPNEEINAWMKKHLPDLGGRAVLMIYKDGRIIYNQSFNDLSKRQEMAAKVRARMQGKEDEEALRDYQDTTRDRIASASKWLTAALAMTFIDEDKLRLNDTVGKFLPVLSRAGKGEIKIWHCLTHTTGIKDGGIRESLMNFQKVKTMDEYMEKIAQMPTEGNPGKVFRYGNTGLQIIAAILEKISGKSFETLFQERIAQPLNMPQTDFGKTSLPLAAGGAWSTPKDYMNFLTMIVQDGQFEGKQIISKALIREMQKNRIPRDCSIAFSPVEAGNWGYGFGEWIGDSPLAICPRKEAIPQSERGAWVCSPGLFGSFPWVNTQQKIAGFLFVYNYQHKGRQERAVSLQQLVQSVYTNNP